MVKLLKKLFAKDREFVVVKTWNIKAISEVHAVNRTRVIAPSQITVNERKTYHEN